MVDGNNDVPDMRVKRFEEKMMTFRQRLKGQPQFRPLTGSRPTGKLS
jgi:hypothetical protein